MHVFAEQVSYWSRSVDSCPMHRYHNLNKDKQVHDINLEEDSVECLQNMVIIKFSNCPKQIPCNLIPVILQTNVCVADITEK